jgi:hypothetical protein
VSSLRLLDAKVGRYEHSHILILRPCKRCGHPFEYLRSLEPGRLYCLDCSPKASRERERKAHATYDDSVEGRQQHHDEEHARRKRRRREAKQKAVEGGRDRRCAQPEGPLQVAALASIPADQERSDEVVREPGSVDRASGPCSGSREEPGAEFRGDELEGRDRRCAQPEGPLQVPALASSPADQERSDEIVRDPGSIDRTSGPCSGSREEPSAESRGGELASVEWTMVAWPGLLATARRRLGAEVVCPTCGRRGIIKRVLALAQWTAMGDEAGWRRAGPS